MVHCTSKIPKIIPQVGVLGNFYYIVVVYCPVHCCKYTTSYKKAMAKLSLATVTTGYQAAGTINNNFDEVATAFENTLSRDGTTPNTMEADLDLNGYNILNQGNPVVVDGFNWRGQWLTATAYAQGDVVQNGGTAYFCATTHTSGTFATDLAASKWQLVVQANLPSQTGNNNKLLTTDGSNASWTATPLVTKLQEGTSVTTASPTYNSTPRVGKRHEVFHGNDSTPTVDGNNPSVYLQRVDNTTTSDDAAAADSPAYLIPQLYTVFKRKATGKGWLYGAYHYVEDASTSGTAQSVGTTGSMHVTGTGYGWGGYDEAWSHNAAATVVGREIDVNNYGGTDHAYDYSNPVNTAIPTSKGLWVASLGTKKASFGIGIGSQSYYNGAGNVAASFGTGIFIQQQAATTYGIDIHAQPATLINFKKGASTDGSGTTRTGVGLDCGENAIFGTPGTATYNQGAINLWAHALCFGNDGAGHALGQMYYDTVNGKLQFYYNGNKIGYINAASPDVQMNGSLAPAVDATASSTWNIAYSSYIYNYSGGTHTATLPSASTYSGRMLHVKTTQNQAVNSASSNIVALATAPGGATTNVILTGTAGKWATLQSNGTYWVVMAGN